MLLPLLLPVVVKALATAVLVVTASVAAERLGPIWGALIASLPVSAGPAYVFLALQHGPDFVATSALGSAVGNAATGLFLISYSVLAARLPASLCLTSSVAVWMIASVLLRQVHWPVAATAVLNCCVYGGGLLLVRDPAADSVPGAAKPSRRTWYELPIRAISVAAFVSLVVGASAHLGPAVTGFAAVFPVSLISLIVILQTRFGGRATARVTVKALAPMFGFGAMLLTLHLAIAPIGMAAAMGLALATCLSWSCLLLWMHMRRLRPTA